MPKARPADEVVYIYVLRDITEAVTYVGQSKQPQVRCRDHGARYEKYRPRNDKNLCMEVIEVVRGEEADEREKYWIRHYAMGKAPLRNGQNARLEKTPRRASWATRVGLPADTTKQLETYAHSRNLNSHDLVRQVVKDFLDVNA